MEPLQRLTRKQLQTLALVGTTPSPPRGVPLNALARALRVSPPSALGHLTVLESLGLVERYRGKTRVSRRGADTLREYTRHHRVAESLFAGIGLSAEDACRAAREVDLAISHTVVEKICASEQHPAQCPHGQPIDPCAGSHPSSVRS